MRGCVKPHAGHLTRRSGGRFIALHPTPRSLTTTTACRNDQQQRPHKDGEHSEEALDRLRRDNVLQQIRDSLHQGRAKIEPAVKKRLEELGKRWNEYSGYEEVTEAKAQTLEAEMHLKQIREHQGQIRKTYMNTIKSRSASQKTLNDLLSRRETWSEADISAYTQLLRDEHAQARSEKEANEKYETIERQVNEAWDDVVKKTLERYHLEQVWSDRVRAGSTYGGLVVAGLNVLLFVTAILVFEPYKRKKLAQTFETRLLQGEAQHTALLSSVVQQFEERIASTQEETIEANKALQLLLGQAGLRMQENGLEDVEPSETVVIVPSPPSVPSSQSVQDKRRDLAMAGGLGFAIGAGILAAMGALRS